MRLGNIAAAERFDGDAAQERAGPLFAHGLALAGGERLQKVVEGRISPVGPMELLASAREIPLRAEPLLRASIKKRHMH